MAGIIHRVESFRAYRCELFDGTVFYCGKMTVGEASGLIFQKVKDKWAKLMSLPYKERERIRAQAKRSIGGMSKVSTVMMTKEQFESIPKHMKIERNRNGQKERYQTPSISSKIISGL